MTIRGKLLLPIIVTLTLSPPSYAMNGAQIGGTAGIIGGLVLGFNVGQHSGFDTPQCQSAPGSTDCSTVTGNRERNDMAIGALAGAVVGGIIGWLLIPSGPRRSALEPLKPDPIMEIVRNSEVTIDRTDATKP